MEYVSHGNLDCVLVLFIQNIVTFLYIVTVLGITSSLVGVYMADLGIVRSFSLAILYFNYN